ncbi:MAG: flagellar biosynthesis anti-sigma factor FlgM [Negativicutes bacterium]|nr:flagellar biosynthesis anti-sigma factor FlgM [Negativicutes bacterium]
MNIKQIQNILKAYGDQNKVGKTAKSEKSSPVMKQDEVILSSRAQSAGQVYTGLYSVPEVREDKVREFAAKIEAGTYYVDAKAIAAKMLQRSHDDKLR